uniref:Uncharacterized protein n=1 Tax=Micrurus surinamensis TaxID=129470 RepID=A0A2D4PY43_MICSU
MVLVSQYPSRHRKSSRAFSATSTASNGIQKEKKIQCYPRGTSLSSTEFQTTIVSLLMQKFCHFIPVYPAHNHAEPVVLFSIYYFKKQSPSVSLKATNGKVSFYLPPTQCLAQIDLYIALL